MILILIECSVTLAKYGGSNVFVDGVMKPKVTMTHKVDLESVSEKCQPLTHVNTALVIIVLLD